jgi:hypothetical protein
MKTIFPFFLVLISISALGQTTKTVSTEMDSIAAKSKCYFVAGSSGGFSGQVTRYYFLSDGNVYRTESLMKKDSLIRHLTKKETKTVFKKLKALHLEKTEFNHPGNMTYFIEQNKKGKVSTVKWGDSTKETPADISAFYKYIMDLIATH